MLGKQYLGCYRLGMAASWMQEQQVTGRPKMHKETADREGI
jgi:hypothetical protein